MSWSLSFSGLREELDSALDHQLAKLAESHTRKEPEMNQIRATVEFIKTWARAADSEQKTVAVALGGHVDNSFTSFSGSLSTNKGP